MSRYHETVAWQADDGLWIAAFYDDLGSFGASDEDGDDEWNREFDINAFEWASKPFTTKEAAIDSSPYPNPGSWNIETFKDSPEEVARLNEIHWEYKNPEAAQAKRDSAEKLWREQSLSSSVIPALNKPVTIKEMSKSGSGVSYTGKLYKSEDGSLMVERLYFSGKKENFTLLTPTGEVAAGHKVSGVEAQFSLPTYGYRSYPHSKPTAKNCGIATPKGPCQRQTFSGRCWQHS